MQGVEEDLHRSGRKICIAGWKQQLPFYQKATNLAGGSIVALVFWPVVMQRCTSGRMAMA